MSKSHAAARVSRQPTFAQLKELMAQIETGRVSQERLQRFLRGEDLAQPLPIETVLQEYHVAALDQSSLPQDVVNYWETKFPGFGKVLTGRLLPFVSKDFSFPTPACYADGNSMRDELLLIHWQRIGEDRTGLSTRFSGQDDFLRDFGYDGELTLEEYAGDLEIHMLQALEDVDYLLRMIVGMEIKQRLFRAYLDFQRAYLFPHLNDSLLEAIDPDEKLHDSDRVTIVSNFGTSLYACLIGTFLPDDNERDGSWNLVRMWAAGVYPVGCRDGSLLFISSS